MIDMSNIEPLPSGHFRLRMQVGKKSIRGTFATVEEAILVRDASKREIADRSMVIVDGQSLVELKDGFFSSRQGNRGIATEKTRWTSHLATATFAHRALSTVTRRDVLDWLDELRTKTTRHRWGTRAAKPLGWQSRKHCLNLLRSFFGWAVEREILTTNPTAGLVVQREDGDEEDGYQENWFLDSDEQSTFLAAWDDFEHPWERAEKSIAGVAIGTGMRQGEQWCLHLKDVQVTGPSPHVVVRFGSWDAKKKRYRSPKGRRGDKRQRVIPLFGLALESMKRWLAALPTYAPKNPLGLAFPSRRGARRGRSKVPRTWARAVLRFGVVDRIGRTPWWHLLRHTCASSLVAGWWGRRWALDDVRAVLGHSSVKVTERYAHLAQSVVHQLATEAQAAWSTSSHVVATNRLAGLKKSLQVPAATGLRSRMSGVRIPPGVPVQNTIGRGNSVATAAGLLARIRDGAEVSTREWVDATCDLIEAVGELSRELEVKRHRGGLR